VRGYGISYHHHGFDDVQSAQSLCRRGGPGESGARQRGEEQEREEEHVLPFYRGICACAEHVQVRAVRAIRAARLDKSILARPCATLCASAFLQVIVAVSFQRPARDDNGNVETKTAYSGLLHHYYLRGPWLTSVRVQVCCSVASMSQNNRLRALDNTSCL